ncbi:AEC family transporter [Thermococcus sp. SY098]|uniref:AEC family transporter n=1 Tax=Thermococcus sp. SY098 TaxID=3111325 RepID=UPI002D79313D|nr:AEC family transporter [Thermococcus sp. SY098]WRS52926.1 AEC family transporter [Thermococcus sp. SY098]
MKVPEMLILIAFGHLIGKRVSLAKVGRFASKYLLAFLIFGNIASKSLDYLLSIKIVFIYAVLVTIICLLSSYLYGHVFIKDHKWRGALIILSVYPNLSALGFPIVSLFVNDITPAVIYASITSMTVVPIVTFVASHFSNHSSTLKESLKASVLFPPSIATVLGVTAVVLNIKIPFLNVIKRIGWLTIPLLLIYFGSRITLKRFTLKSFAEVLVFRSLIPAVFVVTILHGYSDEVFYSVLVESVMPPAISANAILAYYNLKAEEAVSATFAHTILTLAVFIVLSILR